ncbi:MAG: DUF1616 domain-containing protein [archaeon]
MLETIFGLILLIISLTIPGYALSLGFFPKKTEIDLIERIVLSIAFSIAFIPLLLLIGNRLLLLPINYYSAVATVAFLIAVGLIAWFYRSKNLNEKEKIKLLSFT